MAKRPHYLTGPKKGQFKGKRKSGGGKKKRGKKRRKKKTASKARRRKSRPVAKKKRRRSRRSSGGGRITFKEKQNLAIASVAIGYLEENTEILSKLPMATESGSKKNLVYGVALHYLAKQFKGSGGKWLDYASAVFVVRAGTKFGAAKFQMTGVNAEIGADIYDVTDEVSGEIGADG